MPIMAKSNDEYTEVQPSDMYIKGYVKMVGGGE